MIVKKPLALRPLVLVCGLARCGTSLTLQMLHMAGLHCAGEWPAFEPPELITPATSREKTHRYLEAFDACKILDPQRASINWPAFERPIFAFWMKRDCLHQAASQVKLLMQVMGMHLERGGAYAAVSIARALPAEEKAALESLTKSGIPYVVLEFEDAILRPLQFVREIRRSLDPWYELAEERMLACILKRETGEGVAPSMAVELELIERKDPRLK